MIRSSNPFGASSLANVIRELSNRLVELQRPIRILDAIRWDDEVEEEFFAAQQTELPCVDRDWYRDRPLPFRPARKREELADLERDIHTRLGSTHPAARIMRRACGQLEDVIELLEQRGCSAFAALSRRLYGSSRDPLPALPCGGLVEMSRRLAGFGTALAREDLAGEERGVDAATAARLLSEKLNAYFHDGPPVCVQLSTTISADAVAGGDCLKLRRDAWFSRREVRLLEVHEGWVHLSTTRNADRQPVCTFLTRALPSSTTTQEGLAVLTEVLAFAAHPARLQRLANRALAVAMAEGGADFLDVYRFFLQSGCEAHDAYQHSARIFRGSLPSGCGPFTKDLAYSQGFVLVFHHLQQAVQTGAARRIPLLFCGKTSLEDMPDLVELAESGLVLPPRQVPPPFADLRSLCAFVCWIGCLAGLPAAGA